MPQVTIAMPSDTVSKLRASGAILYALKAVGSSDRAGRPLIWFRNASLTESMRVEWTTPYRVYIAPVDVVPVVPATTTPIELGQIWRLAAGGNAVFNGGPAGNLAIDNTTTDPWVCGMMQSTLGPICMFPLFGMWLQTMTPLDKVVLLLSTDDLPPGSVFDSPVVARLFRSKLAASGQALFVDAHDAPGGTRSVTYTLGIGWTWDGGAWARQLPLNSDFQKILIEPPVFQALR